MNINRIVVQVKDLDQGIALYSKLLDTTFHEVPAELATSFGARVAISWEARIELTAPIPGHARAAGAAPGDRDFLWGVVYEVEDVEQARARAKEMGVGIKMTVEMTEDQINTYLQGRYRKFKEYFLDLGQTGKVELIFGQFETKEFSP